MTATHKSRYAEGGPGFRYSDLYERWSAAAAAGRSGEAARLGEEHSRRFLGAQYDRNVRRKR